MIVLFPENNIGVIITSYNKLHKDLDKYIKQGRLSVINIPFVDAAFAFLPTVIAGQLLSYHAAEALDNRKTHFDHITETIKKGRGIENKWNKLKNELGWEPSLQFEEGLSKTIAWYLSNEEWMDNITSGDYQKYYEQQYS